jgi:hypothetical protein
MSGRRLLDTASLPYYMNERDDNDDNHRWIIMMIIEHYTVQIALDETVGTVKTFSS